MYNNNSNRSHAGRFELSNEALEAAAPSIFASGAMAGVSDKYSFIPTSQVVSQMRDAGWAPVEAQAQRVRLEDRRGFQRHMVKFQRRDSLNQARVDDYTSEIALVNSHDRSSAYQLHAALYRYICSNGLMIADSTFQHVSIRHSGNEIIDVVSASLQMLDQIPQLNANVNGFRTRQLTQAEQTEFARQAIVLRWDDATLAPIGTEKVLRPRRTDDAGNDLWTIFNRVQENLIMGGQKDFSRRDEKGALYHRTKAVTGLTENIRLNKSLWQLAETFRSN